jgi:hypothetical protein
MKGYPSSSTYTEFLTVPAGQFNVDDLAQYLAELLQEQLSEQ